MLELHVASAVRTVQGVTGHCREYCAGTGQMQGGDRWSCCSEDKHSEVYN